LKAVKHVKAVVFDWGDTLMRVLEFTGPMAYWPHVALVPGVAEALEQLARQVVLCVASNAGDSDAELMGLALARVGIREYLDYLLTSRELGANKPHPAFFRGVLRALAIEPGECVMVGNDYEKDIAPAKAVGMHTVWFVEAPVTGPKSAADVVICSMADVVTAVAQVADRT
jgi:HAD superfamily hydrolase (TIGR01509 family)